MSNQNKIQEIQEKIKYQKALYRFYECDDPVLKEHYASIIKGYESHHQEYIAKTLVQLSSLSGRTL